MKELALEGIKIDPKGVKKKIHATFSNAHHMGKPAYEEKRQAKIEKLRAGRAEKKGKGKGIGKRSKPERETPAKKAEGESPSKKAKLALDKKRARLMDVDDE